MAELHGNVSAGLESSRNPRSESEDFFETYGLRVLRALRKIIRAVDIHSRKLKQNFNITAPQLVCLHALERRGELTLSQLANEVSLGASTTNGIVDRLELKGCLTRTRSQQDRRKVMLALTDGGRDLLRATPALLQDEFSEALRRLPELEQAAIALSLERVVSLMGVEHLDTSPMLVPNAQLTQTNGHEPKGLTNGNDHDTTRTYHPRD